MEGERDVSPGSGEEQRSRPANSPAPAGDQGDLTAQVDHA